MPGARKDIYTERTDSTMNLARREAAAVDPAVDVLVVRTDHQEQGRGRSGAVWHDIPGQSVLMTVAIRRNSFWDPRDPVAATIALRSAAAVVQTIETYHPLSPPAVLAIKWPNDILIDNRKVCGILVEATSQWFFAGIGLNLATGLLEQRVSRSPAAGAAPLELPHPPVGIYEYQPGDAPPEIWAQWIVEMFLAALRDNWWYPVVHDRLAWQGEAVSVMTDGDSAVIRGILTGVNEDGALILKDALSGAAFPPLFAGTLRREK